jgi:hypothetical protein
VKKELPFPLLPSPTPALPGLPDVNQPHGSVLPRNALRQRMN